MDANGSLLVSNVFDYETDDHNYTIMIRATDDHNVSFDKNFTATVTNVVEDLDGDGTEDYYDLDDDGDGLSDLDEVHFKSDPRDANSPYGSRDQFCNIPGIKHIRGCRYRGSGGQVYRVGQQCQSDQVLRINPTPAHFGKSSALAGCE